MINSLLKKLERAKGRQQSKLEEKENVEKRILTLKKNIKRTEKAQVAIQIVAKKTQEELEYSISEPASLALATVFDKPYTVHTEFEIDRKKTKCEISFERDGEFFNPLIDAGNGTANMAALGLRSAVWSIKPVRSRALFLLDEPFPGLKGEDANIRAFQMVSEALCSELELQVIMIADERVSLSKTKRYADKLFRTTKVNGVTQVEEL